MGLLKDVVSEVWEWMPTACPRPDRSTRRKARPHPHKPGDAVEISGGPFAEFVATVENVDPDQRVWVLLELMGRTMRVAVHPDALRQV